MQLLYLICFISSPGRHVAGAMPRRAMHPFGMSAVLVEPGRFFTHINSRENVDPLTARSWAQAAPEVKAEYGEEYYRSC